MFVVLLASALSSTIFFEFELALKVTSEAQGGFLPSGISLVLTSFLYCSNSSLLMTASAKTAFPASHSFGKMTAAINLTCGKNSASHTPAACQVQFFKKYQVR